jgi:hypothetical protein
MIARGAVACLLAILGGALFASPVAAHPALDRARELYRDARFEEALAALTEAERATDLSRDDLLSLYETRALVRFAMSDRDAAEQDLTRLASIDRDRPPAAEMPPSLRRALDAARARVETEISVRAEIRRAPGGAHATGHVENDAEGVVRTVLVKCRVGDAEETEWQSGPLEVAARASQSVECVARAVGPGAAVIAEARASVAGEPVRAPPGIAPTPADVARAGTGTRADLTAEATGDDGDRDGGGSAWPWILGIGGGAIAIAAGVVLVVVLTSAQAEVTVGGPRFE